MATENAAPRVASHHPSRDELVRRAEAMLPALRERSREAEANRRLADETASEMLAAGFHKIMQPAHFGGFAMGIDTAADCIRTLASGCGSAGWISNLFIIHNFQVGLFPMEAQDEYWGDGGDVVASTLSFAPRSEMHAVDGGFRVSGHWKFASGCDFASWFILMKPSATCHDWLLIPRSDVTIEDDWFVAGLSGTGSKDVILDDVFVPAHRHLAMADLMAGTTPGGAAHGTKLARLPFVWTAMWGIPAAIVGMAAGMAESVRQSLVNKRLIFAGERQVDRVANQIGMAEALAEINAAELVLRHGIERLQGWADGKAPAASTDPWVSHRDATFATRKAHRVAANLSLMAGANSVYLSSPIQRFHRDIDVGATHFSLNWEEAAENYGRALWELPPKMPKS